MKTLNPKDHYLVAVSFGPDSMALLHMLIQQGFHVSVAHVNYHRRSESNVEQSGLEQFCLNHDIPCYVLDVSQPLPKGNFQAEARKVRYSFFKDIYEDIHADALLTAHHEDDHIETALFHEQRNAWVPFYGIPHTTLMEGMKVIRPLLSWTKADLLAYCGQHQVPFSVDVSNQSVKYTRNRLRHQIIAHWSLEERRAYLKKIHHINQDQQTFIDGIQQKHPDFLPLDLFHQTPLKVFLTLYAYFRFHHLSFPISKAFVNQIKKVAKSSKPNWERKIDQGLLIKHYDRFEWIELPSHQTIAWIYKGKAVQTPWMEIHPSSPQKPDWLVSGIHIRSGQPTDRWWHQGKHYRLNRLWGDWKMPLYLRKYWPVFLNSQGQIIYVPRYQREPKVPKNSWFVFHTKKVILP